jgi:hypothetical protein
MYDDYKHKVVGPTSNDGINTPENNEKTATYYADFKNKNNQDLEINEGIKEANEVNAVKSDEGDAPPKMIFKKLKTKMKGDKENVLKTIKLKLK